MLNFNGCRNSALKKTWRGNQCWENIECRTWAGTGQNMNDKEMSVNGRSIEIGIEYSLLLNSTRSISALTSHISLQCFEMRAMQLPAYNTYIIHIRNNYIASDSASCEMPTGCICKASMQTASNHHTCTHVCISKYCLHARA